ncbi:hypothetical protein [Hyphomonas sp.]|uniref:hypothetical protein n=1 Tax=Hyphomonas sp. TaxID=87 RepID=UPI00391AD945
MIRFVAIFTGLLALCLILMAALLAQYGLSLLAPEMQPMLLVCILVAAYVSWRITMILKRREGKSDTAAPVRTAGFSPGLFGGLSGGKSKALQAREARVAARRRQLIAEGKLAPEPEETPAEKPDTPAQPTRVATSASVKEKMAARAERVRRAREEGKI